MDIVLRDFQDPDFESLWAMDQQCFAPGIAYSRRELRTYVSAPGVFTVVALAGDSVIVGFIVAQSNRRNVGHVITIDVLANGRRKGVGSQLLSAAEQRLRKVNCLRVRLETAVDNVSAIAFYRRHGYEITKTIEGYYSDGVDAFSLEKTL